MRVDLVVPFSEKDRVKALGARWDIARKRWYVEDIEDLTPFLPWIPARLKAPVKPASPSVSKPRRKSAKRG